MDTDKPARRSRRRTACRQGRRTGCSGREEAEIPSAQSVHVLLLLAGLSVSISAAHRHQVQRLNAM
ncbi:hypothetical protein, partial [Mycolicibacterium fortuitum]|uniref:hypothetical protein n=1 Tax=Mycolicibacterium fortuitum TaxID=1766 RepID=UPI001C260C43